MGHGLCVTWAPYHHVSPRFHVTWALCHRVTQQLHVTVSPGSMSPCHCGSAIPGSMSPGLHVTGCHSMLPCLWCSTSAGLSDTSTPVGSVSPGLCVTMSPAFHVTWTLHHRVTWQLCVPVSPGLHVTWAPCPPVSPASSMSLCHPGSISPGLYVIVSPSSSMSLCHLGSTGLHITRAPCHWLSLHVTVSLWFHNAWLHVTLCHPAAPCHHVTLPPHHLGSTSQGLCVTWAPCHPVSPGSTVSLWFRNAWLHVTWTLRYCVTWQLCVPVSPGFHWAPHHLAAPYHCVTVVLQCLAPHHQGSMSPALYVIVSPGSSVSLCHPGSIQLHVTQQLHVTVSPWFHITRAPCHPVSPGSSISPCHLGSTIPGSMSPGLHDMGHRLCVTRAL